jgi:uncharacterized protein
MNYVRARRLTAVLAAALTTACGTSSIHATSPADQIVPSVNRDVSFVVDGTTTYGTLYIPAHKQGQRLAAALLLPGSGPTDRNGDQPGQNINPQTLKLIAGILGQQGIMSLRFDKYFAGETGAGAFASDPGSIDIAAFIRQADAAYDLLLQQPEADPRAMAALARADAADPGLRVLQGLNHYLHPAGTPVNDAVIAPAAVAAIQEFLRPWASRP